ADPTGQLLLLPSSPVLAESSEHARFRLSTETRQRGLRHVAEIRARLSASASAAKPADASPTRLVELPRRRWTAA
ncbi:MAG: hypothetical protein AAGG08_19630, partial [Actinomycetota bacterium]